MKIGVNIYPMLSQQAGIHQFTKQLAQAVEAHGTMEYVLMSPISLETSLPVVQFPEWVFSLRDPRHWLLGRHRTMQRQNLDWILDPSHYGMTGMFPGIKRCVVIHDLTAVLFPGFHPAFTSIPHRLLMKKSLAEASMVVAISQNTEKDLAEHYAGRFSPKTVRIYPGFKGPQGELRPPPTHHFGQYFLMVGTAEPRKNHQRAIAAFERYLDQSGSTTGLVIVGPEGWRVDVSQYIQNSRYPERMVWARFVDEPELKSLYDGATALIYPSLYEGFGFPVLEAMSLGCPVITSARGALKETAGDAALVIDPEDVEAISDAMAVVAGDPLVRQQLAERGKTHCEQFSWLGFVKELEAHLNPNSHK